MKPNFLSVGKLGFLHVEICLAYVLRFLLVGSLLEVFDQVKNVEFTHFDELGADLPVFKIIEPTAEEWNKKARRQNINMFIEITGRHPGSYAEVREWINGNKENHIAGNDTAFGTIIN